MNSLVVSYCNLFPPVVLMLAASVALAHDDYRTWMSAKGSHQTVARLVSSSGEKVTLEKETGERITVQIDALSVDDQEFIDKARGSMPASDDGEQLETPRTTYSINQMKVAERRMLFAGEAIAFYERVRDNGWAEPEAVDFVTQRLEALEPLRHTGGIRFFEKYVTESELKQARTQSRDLVNQWYAVASNTNGRNQLEKLEQAMDVDPVCNDAPIFLGLHYHFFERDYLAAKKFFQEAIKRSELYYSLHEDYERFNHVAALNNMAVLYARDNQIGNSYKQWRRTLDLGPEELVKWLGMNVRKTIRFAQEKNYGIKGTRSDEKRYEELTASLGSPRGGSSSTGWLLILPKSPDRMNQISSDFLLRKIDPGVRPQQGLLEDFVCLVCEGAADKDCPDAKCRGGKKTTRIMKPVRDQYGNIVARDAQRVVSKCGTCDGDGRVKCWGCGADGVQK